MEHQRRTSDTTIARIESEVQHLGDAYQGLDQRFSLFEAKVDRGFAAVQDTLTKQSKPNYMLGWVVVTGCLSILLVLGNMRVAPIEQAIETLIQQFSSHTAGGHPNTVISQVSALTEKHNTELDTLKEKHDTELEALRREHQAQVDLLQIQISYNKEQVDRLDYFGSSRWRLDDRGSQEHAPHPGTLYRKKPGQ